MLPEFVSLYEGFSCGKPWKNQPTTRSQD